MCLSLCLFLKLITLIFSWLASHSVHNMHARVQLWAVDWLLTLLRFQKSRKPCLPQTPLQRSPQMCCYRPLGLLAGNLRTWVSTPGTCGIDVCYCGVSGLHGAHESTGLAKTSRSLAHSWDPTVMGGFSSFLCRFLDEQKQHLPWKTSSEISSCPANNSGTS